RLLSLADRSVAALGKRLKIRREYELSTWLAVHYRPDRVIAAVPDPEQPVVIRSRHPDSSVLIRPDPQEPWQLEVSHDQGGTLRLSGPLGLNVAGKLLATLNGAGATDEIVRYAVTKLEDASNPSGYFARVAMIAMRCWWGKKPDATAVIPASLASSDAERLALHLTKRSFLGRGGVGREPPP